MTDATNPHDALSDHLHGQSAPASDTGGNAMTELKPCPFCGCTTINEDMWDTETRWYECGRCRASGPAEQPDKDPPQGWNIRADLTQPQTVTVEVKPLVWDLCVKGIKTLETPIGKYWVFSSVRGDGFRAAFPGFESTGTVDSEIEAMRLCEDHYRAFSLSLITTRSVEEVRNEAIDRMEWDTQKVLADWFRRGVSGEKMQDAPSVAARSLKSRPVPAPAQDEALDRLWAAICEAENDAREFFADAEYTGERPDLHDTTVEVYADDLRTVLAAMEGR